jgi:general secretion pathway protein L
MTLVITRFPTSERDDPSVFRVAEGVWQEAGALSNFVPTVDDITVMALVAPEDVRCHWLTLPDMQGRQAESVAKLRATEQSLGLVHCSAGADYDDVVATATIASEVMQFGLDILKARGLNPDIVLPFALSLSVHSDGISKAEMDGLSVLRGEQFAIPDDAVLRDMFIGDAPIETIDADSIRSMLLSASAAPLLNLREGKFAKRERANWMTAEQKIWVQRLLIALLIVNVEPPVEDHITLARALDAVPPARGQVEAISRPEMHLERARVRHVAKACAQLGGQLLERLKRRRGRARSIALGPGPSV